MCDLGSRLQMLRKQRGITQKVLARRINKSIAAISSYETNVQSPPLDVLISIAMVLNVSLDYLVGFDNRDLVLLDTLTAEQRKVVYMLLEEFNLPTSEGKHLSDSQKDILERTLSLFYRKNC